MVWFHLARPDLVKLDILLAGEPVDVLSMLVHRSKAYDAGRTLTEKLREKIPPPAVRRPDPGGDRVADRRAGDDQGIPQGRDRQVLRG
jgi:hypothetical protein